MPTSCRAARGELGNAEREAQLEATLSGLQTAGPPTATDKAADPGAKALSVDLAALGLVLPAGLLSDWLTLIPVLALEAGAALAMVLVQSVGGAQTERQIPPMIELATERQAETRPERPQSEPTPAKPGQTDPEPNPTPPRKRTPKRTANRTRRNVERGSAMSFVW